MSEPTTVEEWMDELFLQFCEEDGHWEEWAEKHYKRDCPTCVRHALTAVYEMGPDPPKDVKQAIEWLHSSVCGDCNADECCYGVCETIVIQVDKTAEERGRKDEADATQGFMNILAINASKERVQEAERKAIAAKVRALECTCWAFCGVTMDHRRCKPGHHEECAIAIADMIMKPE